MRALFLFVLALVSQLACGQGVKTVSIPTSKNLRSDADTSFSFTSDRATASKIHLPDLRKSTDAFHFRLWSGRQALDIWTLESKRYFGAVTSYAQRYNAALFAKNNYRIDTVIFKQIALPNAKAKQIFQLIDSLAIISIPTDNQIAGWQEGLDGTEYRIETSTPSSYAYKTYWAPSLFTDTLWEARQIQTLIDKLYANFTLADYTKHLKLLPGHYQHDGVEGVQIRTVLPDEEPKHRTSIFDWF